MHVNELTDDTLRSLSEVEAPEPVVVSLFLDLDPTEFATPGARETQFNSLLNELDAQIAEQDLSHDAREALKADRARIDTFLREELDASGAAAVAVYSARALDVFRTITLAEPLDPGVHLDVRPLLGPLPGHEDAGEWCVALVTRETGRVFRGGPTGLRELRGVRSQVTNQHQQGGWSQARYERGVEREVEWHLEAVTERLRRQLARRPFAHLVIGADEALRPAFDGEAHEDLRRRIRGWVDLDERLASPEEVLEAVRPVMERHAAEAEAELLERHQAETATGGRAATGLAEVLPALVERRVETLIIEEGASAPGTKCVTCGWIGGAEVERCPVDDTVLDPVENIVEPAIQAAVQQSAGVHVIRRRDVVDEDPNDAGLERNRPDLPDRVLAVLRF